MGKDIKEATLDQIPFNRRLVEKLFAENLISSQTRLYILDILFPSKNWGLWASRLLLIAAFSLILSSIVYFFAFNWAKIPDYVKLGSIEIGLIASIIGAYFYKIEKLIGQILLTSASIFVGVFFAVFGQIYQTGADAYQLFMLWSFFILPWTILSNFNFQWLLWYLVTSFFLFFYWQQSFLKVDFLDLFICVYLALFSLFLLALRELVVEIKKLWVPAYWTRIFLVVVILTNVLIPSVIFIFAFNKTSINFSIQMGAILSIFIHMLFYVYFRYKRKDIICLSLTYLSFCILLDSIMARLLFDFIPESRALIYLILLLFTLSLFSFVIFRLYRISLKIRVAS